MLNCQRYPISCRNFYLDRFHSKLASHFVYSASATSCCKGSVSQFDIYIRLILNYLRHREHRCSVIRMFGSRFSPHSIVIQTVLVAVGVRNGQNIPIDGPNNFPFGAAIVAAIVFDQFFQQPRCHRRRNPFATMYAAFDEDAWFAGLFLPPWFRWRFDLLPWPIFIVCEWDLEERTFNGNLSAGKVRCLVQFTFTTTSGRPSNDRPIWMRSTMSGYFRCK